MNSIPLSFPLMPSPERDRHEDALPGKNIPSAPQESHSPHEQPDRSVATPLVLQPQEIPLDHPDSCNFFQPSPTKPFVATPAALNTFGVEAILRCLVQLQVKAAQHQGLDYLQVFEDPVTHERLWFMEDGEGGAITAMLPSDY